MLHKRGVAEGDRLTKPDLEKGNGRSTFRAVCLSFSRQTGGAHPESGLLSLQAGGLLHRWRRQPYLGHGGTDDGNGDGGFAEYTENTATMGVYTSSSQRHCWSAPLLVSACHADMVPGFRKKTVSKRASSGLTAGHDATVGDR